MPDLPSRRRASNRRCSTRSSPGAKLYPSADLLARGGGKMSGDNSGLQGAALSMTWELDLWGRVRYGRAAARADAASAQADFEYARQSLAATVAKSWFLAIEAALQAEVARAQPFATTKSWSVWPRRERASASATRKTSSSLARTSGVYRDSLAPARVGARTGASRARVAARPLSGGGRHHQCAIARAARALPGGLPSELLERRPDVIAAERRDRGGVQPRRRSQSGPAAGHRAHDRASTRSRAICSCSWIATTRSGASAPICCMPIFRGRRAQDAGRDPDGRTEASGCGLRRGRTARVRRSGERARPPRSPRASASRS